MSIQQVIKELNQMLQGWIVYFRLANGKGHLEELEAWLLRHLRKIHWRQWKKPRTRFDKLLSLSTLSLYKPPYTGPYVRWCWETEPSYPINQQPPDRGRLLGGVTNQHHSVGVSRIRHEDDLLAMASLKTIFFDLI